MHRWYILFANNMLLLQVLLWWVSSIVPFYGLVQEFLRGMYSQEWNCWATGKHILHFITYFQITSKQLYQGLNFPKQCMTVHASSHPSQHLVLPNFHIFVYLMDEKKCVVALICIYLIISGIVYLFIYFFKLKYSWHTILCKLQVYNIVIHNF